MIDLACASEGADSIPYRRGMPYGEFLQMMEQRRATDLKAGSCEHPFEAIDRKVRGKRRAAGVVVIVEYTCTACDSQIGRDVQGFKL